MSVLRNSPLRLGRSTPQKYKSTPSKVKVFADDVENMDPNPKASTNKFAVGRSPPKVSSARKVLSRLTPNGKTPSKAKYSDVSAADVVQKLSNQLSQKLDLEPVLEQDKECAVCIDKETQLKEVKAHLINAQEVNSRTQTKLTTKYRHTTQHSTQHSTKLTAQHTQHTLVNLTHTPPSGLERVQRAVH